MILLWLACAPDDGAGTGTATKTYTTSVPEGALPLAEALAERCPDPTPPRVVPTGAWMHRATLAEAEARCNDGTPPVLYLRANSDPAHARDWVVHLAGDGSCSDYETCAARWCGEGGPDAGDMSSQWAPPTGGHTGIFTPQAALNDFAGWNVAQIYYCSSDLWVGTAQTGFEGDVTYEIAFRGAGILTEALAALDGGLTSDDGLILMPKLTDAETILFAGSSAGASAVLTHLGRVVDAYPGARVVGVADSTFSASPEVLTAEVADDLAASIQERYDEVIEGVYHGYVDPGCLEAGGSPAECSDPGYLLREAVEGEIVYRHDLFDPVLAGVSALAGIRGEDYAAAGEATLRGYAAAGFAVLGPTCGTHTSLEGGGFFGEQVADALAGPPARSLHDLLSSAVDGSVLAAIDGVDGAGSLCP